MSTVINIDAAAKEDILNEIIKAQYDLIKVQMDCLARFEGRNKVEKTP